MLIKFKQTKRHLSETLQSDLYDESMLQGTVGHPTPNVECTAND